MKYVFIESLFSICCIFYWENNQIHKTIINTIMQWFDKRAILGYSYGVKILRHIQITEHTVNLGNMGAK